MTCVNWFEIGVIDLQRAVEFYRNIFSISIRYAHVDGQQHALLQLSGTVGGILHPVETIGATTTLFFHVDRMSEVLDKVPLFGGSVVQPKTLLKAYDSADNTLIAPTMFDGKTGYIAKIKDTEGNLLGLHANA